jgi:hypothetical protein
MTPRPIHRWKSFWLGIVILLSLGWAWLVSMDHYTVLRLEMPGQWLRLLQIHGKVGIVTDDWPGHAWNLRMNDQHGIAGDPIFWKDVIANARVLAAASHGQLALLFLIPWLTFLTWRWQRMKRQAARSAELERSESGPGQLP